MLIIQTLLAIESCVQQMSAEIVINNYILVAY